MVCLGNRSGLSLAFLRLAYDTTFVFNFTFLRLSFTPLDDNGYHCQLQENA